MIIYLPEVLKFLPADPHVTAEVRMTTSSSVPRRLAAQQICSPGTLGLAFLKLQLCAAHGLAGCVRRLRVTSLSCVS